jgi:hypothetical protein
VNILLVAIARRRRSLLLLLSTCPLIAIVSAVPVSLTAAAVLSLHQRSFTCCYAFKAKMQ